MKAAFVLMTLATIAFADVQIGDQVWLGKNVDNDLKVTKTPGGEPFFGLDYSEYNLYTFENATKACPAGYRLPSDDDWRTLVSYVKSHKLAGSVSQNLMAGKWGYNGECCDYENGNPNDCIHDPMEYSGLDAFGFSALAGSIGASGFMLGEGPCMAHEANFWSSSKKVLTLATDNAEPALAYQEENLVAAVRCIKGSAENGVIEITARNLRKEYASNKFRADSKYRGKQLKISGTIYKIDQNNFGAVYVKLETDDLVNQVECFLKPSEYGKAYDLNKGQKITLVGVGAGEDFMDVRVNDCEIK